jgi:hypothetical protein
MKKRQKKNRGGIKKRSTKETLSYRTITIRADDSGPETLDEESRSFEITLATETPVDVLDFERFEIVPEVLLMSGAELPKSRQIPLLDSHNRFGASSVLGSIRGLKISNGDLVGRAHFSSIETDTWTKAREGHLTDFSAGYKPIKSHWIPEGESFSYRGKTYNGPLRLTQRWKIREGSVVAIGADELAKARALSDTAEVDEDNQKNKELENMDKKTRQWLETLGLRKDADEDEAYKFMAGLKIQTENDDNTRAAGDGDKKTPPEDVNYQNADIEKIRNAAQGEELERILEILALGERWDNQELASDLIRSKKTAFEAYRAFDDFLQKKKTDDMKFLKPAVIEADEVDKFRDASIDALIMRSEIAPSYKPEKFAVGYQDLMGFSLRELARESLRRAGKKTGGDVMSMVGRALATDDLPYILANVANKALFTGWDTAAETWSVWCGTGSVSDFKTHYMPRISEADDLEEIPEHGEYRYGIRTEAQEEYSVATYGKLFAITRQTIINDDLGALIRIPSQHGESASRKVGDVAYAVLTANAAMGDGTALFHADHGNFVDNGSGAAPGQATIAAGILAMKSQKDLRGLRRLNIRPVYLICPVALEGGTEVFLTSFQYADSDTVATDSSLAATRQNPYAGSYFTRVYEPRLDDDDAAAWYLAGPKGKTVNVYFLNGVQTPYLETKQGWTVDGTEYKVRIDCGAKAVDWRGLYFNDGN